MAQAAKGVRGKGRQPFALPQHAEIIGALAALRCYGRCAKTGLLSGHVEGGLI
jgi:hypothetical protein